MKSDNQDKVSIFWQSYKKKGQIKEERQKKI